MPKTAAFTGFTQSGDNTSNSGQFNVSGSFNRGWNFYINGWKNGKTIFFEAFGIRDTYSGRSTGVGTITFVSEHGSMWVSGVNSTSAGRCFCYHSGGVSTLVWYDRATGYTVWSDKE